MYAILLLVLEAEYGKGGKWESGRGVWLGCGVELLGSVEISEGVRWFLADRSLMR